MDPREAFEKASERSIAADIAVDRCRGDLARLGHLTAPYIVRSHEEALREARAHAVRAAIEADEAAKAVREAERLPIWWA